MKDIHALIDAIEHRTGQRLAIQWDQAGPKDTFVRRHYMLVGEAGRTMYVQFYERGGWEVYLVSDMTNKVDNTLDAVAAYLAK